MGTDLNPTENAFGGDPEKMSNGGRVLSHIGHLRPQAPSKMGTPDAAPAENQGFSPGDPDFQPHPKIRDFVTGTPALPRPLLSQRVPISV